MTYFDGFKNINFNMKVGILVIVSLLVSCVYGAGPVYDVNLAPGIFAKFVKDFDKTYKSLQDLLTHYESFKRQLVKINAYNKLTSSSTTINEFTDYTDEEKIAIISAKAVSNP